MKLKVSSPRLPRELLLPLFVLFDSPLPVLLPLNVLASLLRIRSQPERLGESALLLESHKVARNGFGSRGLFDHRSTVRQRRRPL